MIQKSKKESEMKKPGPPDPTYDVGYKKPPKATQFAKGRSGNPRGRKRGHENLVSIFKRLAAKPIRMNDGGKIRIVTMADAVILQNYKAALQKDQNAMGNILQLAEEAGEFIDRTDPKQVGKPIFMPAKVTLEEFMAEHGVKFYNERLEP
jgi:hypothetical protein